MTISGEELGAELYDLRLAGRKLLPEVAAVYAQGTRHLHNTGWSQETGFGGTPDSSTAAEPWGLLGQVVLTGEYRVGDDSSAPAMGAAYANWTALRDQLQYYLAETANSLLAAGTALELIARDYAATDDAAAAELRRQSEDLGGRPEMPEPKLPGMSYDTVPGPLGAPVPRDEPLDPLPGN